MNIQAYNDHYLAQEEVTETSPLEEKTLVDNVIGKALTLSDIGIFERIHLKCDRATAIQLRELYTQVIACNRMKQGSLEYSTHSWEYS